MNEIPADQAAFDIGPKTLEMFARMTKGAKTIFWNGPMGVFETKPFDAGTRGVAQLMADSGAFTVVGGGESVEAINEAGLGPKISHVSTGGGASLDLISGKKLPGRRGPPLAPRPRLAARTGAGRAGPSQRRSPMKPGRTPLVVANWKMNKTPSEAAAFCDDFLSRLPSLPETVDLAIAPAFPALERVGRHLAPTRVKLAAQDVHVEPKGAFTGEVSVAMLADLGVAMALVGHSERRRDRKETEADFSRKMKRLADAGLVPVYCVGETLEERDGGRTEAVLAAQMKALDLFGEALPPGFVLAYEPVWAIGTGPGRDPRDGGRRARVPARPARGPVRRRRPRAACGSSTAAP